MRKAFVAFVLHWEGLGGRGGWTQERDLEGQRCGGSGGVEHDLSLGTGERHEAHTRAGAVRIETPNHQGPQSECKTKQGCTSLASEPTEVGAAPDTRAEPGQRPKL